MNVSRILEEPMKINGITDRAERQQRIKQVLEELSWRLLKITCPVSSYAQWRSAAAVSHRRAMI